MPMGRDYSAQDCSIARALEVVGERWTFLVLRDCFMGVRRFSDFRARLDLPRAVLADRLTGLVEAGLLDRVEYAKGRFEYVLTERGIDLWPALQALGRWGDRHFSPDGPRRLIRHVACGTDTVGAGLCPTCGRTPTVDELEIRPGPGAVPDGLRTDPVSRALLEPHRMLERLPPPV